MYRILYVDDEPALLEIGKLFLEEGGKFSVDICPSASDGLTLLKSANYDAIISDYQMPGIDGIEFLKRVRTSGSTIPFILFTGRGREEVVIQALNAGADFYLQKGGEPESQFVELAHKIRQSVQQRQAEIMIRDHERREADIINFLPDATFAIDTSGVVILWNRAMEQMTGIKAAEMLGKGNYEYAVPFYHEHRPILIDLVLKDDPIIAGKYPGITRDGTTLYSEITIPHFNNGQGAVLWFTASPLYNMQGTIVGAIESIREITERKLAEENVRKSEAQFHSLYTNMIEGAALHELKYNDRGIPEDYVIVETNPAFEKHLGIPRDRIIGKTSREAYGVTEPPYLEIYTRVALTGESEVFQTYFQPLDKYFSISAYCPAKGKFATIFEDITERKLAEEELRESEERYRNVVEVQTEFISRFRPNGTHVFVNEAYCRYFGLKRDEILGHRFQPKIPAEDQKRVRQFFESLSPDHPVDIIEHRIIMPDGNIRWQRWSDRAIFDPSGTITEYQSVGQDITERKQEEQALHENEQHLTSIYNTVGDVIFQLTVEPHEQYRFTSVNSAFSKTTGLPSEHVIGKKVNEIIPEPSLSMVLEKYRLAIKEKAIVRWEETSNYPSGQLTGEVRIAPIFDKANNCTHLIGSVHDITEHKRVEEELTFKNVLLSTQQETSLDAILVVDENRKILNYNQKFIEIWGIAVNLFASRMDEPVLQFVVGQLADPEAFLSWVRYFYDHKKERNFEEILLKDGRILEWFSAPMMGEKENYYGRVWYFRDITERKRADEALRESEAKYRDLAELLPQMIFEMDTDFRITYANRHAITVFGITDKDFEHGINALSFIEPSQHAKVKDNAQKQLNGLPVEPQEYTTLRKDGSTFQVIIYTAPIYRNQTITGLRGVIVDISERKKIDDELRENEEKYRLVVENSYNAIYIYRDRQILFANRRATDLTGYTHDELLGMNIWDLVYPDDLARLQKSGKRRISGSALPPNFTGRIIKKSGEVLDCEFFVNRILYQNQPALLGIIKDIAEQKKAENVLRESQKNFRTVLDNLPDLVLVHRDGFILYVNPAMIDTMGLRPDEVLNKPILDYIAPEYHPRVAAAIRERIKTGRDRPYEIEILPRAGGRRAVLIRGSVIVFDGSPAILNVLTDINEHRKAEQELRESEEKFRSLVETSPDIIWEIDLLGKFQYISSKVKTILGYTPEELGGKPITDLIPEQNRSFIMQELTRYISSDGPFLPLEVPARHRNGYDRVIEIRPSKVIGLDGKMSGLRGVAHDITARKRADEALRMTNRQLHLLTGITRHDILNNISVILGFLKIAEKKFNDPGLDELLGKMESATKAIRSQIEFTRLYQDLGTHEPQWIDLNTFIPRLQVPSTITLNADVQDVGVFADPMLEKVFFNILDNSIRHGQRVTEIQVSSHQSGEDLVVVWEDNGIGIADNEKERIFERGFGKNTGLGMFLVREILSLTGITIRETGIPGKGARFDMTVPKGAWR